MSLCLDEHHTENNHSTQQPLAWHMIELEPDAVGVFEQQRVVAGRPLVFARRADDIGVDRGEESVQFIDGKQR